MNNAEYQRNQVFCIAALKNLSPFASRVSLFVFGACSVTNILPVPSILIKKYANRRLYDTSKSSYVTIEDLTMMVRGNIDFHIEDARTGQDLTRVTLIQIILDIETDGHDMLPVMVLRQLIQAYGERTEPILSRYLERVMIAFLRHQRSAEDALDASLDDIHGTVQGQENDAPAQALPVKDAGNSASIAALRAEFALLKAKMDDIA